MKKNIILIVPIALLLIPLYLYAYPVDDNDKKQVISASDIYVNLEQVVFYKVFNPSRTSYCIAQIELQLFVGYELVLCFKNKAEFNKTLRYLNNYYGVRRVEAGLYY